MPALKQFYGYVRFSAAKQAVSLTDQRNDIARYADLNGFEISRWLVEPRAAGKSHQPVLADVVTLLRDRKADGAILYDPSHAGRDMGLRVDLIELVDRGIEIHFATQNPTQVPLHAFAKSEVLTIVTKYFLRSLPRNAREGPSLADNDALRRCFERECELPPNELDRSYHIPFLQASLHQSYWEWLREHGLDPETGRMTADGRAFLAECADTMDVSRAYHLSLSP